MESNKLKKLRFLRRGKKASITKRINMLNSMVSEGGSRRIISSLVDKLRVVFEETQVVCDQIAGMSEEMDELNCLEALRITMDMCVAFAIDYLQEHKDDPPSMSSFTSSWVYRYGLEEIPEKNEKQSAEEFQEKDEEILADRQRRGIPCVVSSVQNNILSFRGAGNTQSSQISNGVVTVKDSGYPNNIPSYTAREERPYDGEKNLQAGIDFVSCVESNKFSLLGGDTPSQLIKIWRSLVVIMCQLCIKEDY